MAYGIRRKAPLRRKLQILRRVSGSSKQGRERFAISVALLLYIRKLKLGLAALARDYCALYATNRRLLNHAGLLKNHVTVEKVENTAPQSYEVRIWCERKGGRLVPILEALEKMGLTVLQARVSCDKLFSMEATAFATAHARALEARDVAQTILRAIENKKKEKKKKKMAIKWEE
ncbi:hypothetical protein SAY87_031350 [Trapa incisa]|uniref:Plant bHLH transcription factor ACT-like domain-containing protein n=1 Tax=Trapa incisa TaxID=236973 RepID=A0AAN7KKE5_9MYRT|nr:hypothetical protein SAY87_031350 [Trapa incisa]